MKKKMLHEYTLKQLLIEEDLNESIADLIGKPTQWVMRQIQKVFPQNKTAKQEGLNDEALERLMKKWPVWGIVYDMTKAGDTSWLRTFQKPFVINVEGAPELSAGFCQVSTDGSMKSQMEFLADQLNHPEYGAALRAPAPDHNPEEAPPPIDIDQLIAAFGVIVACMRLNSDEPQKACYEFLSNLGGGGGGIGDWVGKAGILLGVPLLAGVLPAGLATLGSVLAYAAVVGMLAGSKADEIDKKQLDVIVPILFHLIDDGDGKLDKTERSITPQGRASEASQKLIDAWVDFESQVIPSLMQEPYQMPDIANVARRAMAQEFNLLYYLELIEDDEQMADKFEELFSAISDKSNQDYRFVRDSEEFDQISKRREQRAKEKNEKFIKDFNDKYGELQDITDEELSAALGEALNRAIRIIQMEDKEQ